MHKKTWVLAGAAAFMALMLSGCFSNPTSPGAFGSMDSGSNSGGGQSGGGEETSQLGTITGTISGTNGAPVSIGIQLSETASISTERTGDGAYTLSGVPAGAYVIIAMTQNRLLYGSVAVTVTAGATVSNANITLHSILSQ